MKNKIRKGAVVLSAAAMLFTTAVILPKEDFNFSITANAESTDGNWLEVGSDYTFTNEYGTFECIVASSTENEASVIWKEVISEYDTDSEGNKIKHQYENKDEVVSRCEEKGGRLIKYAEYQTLLDNNIVDSYSDGVYGLFACQEYESCYISDGKLDYFYFDIGTSYDFFIAFDINRNPIKAVSDSLFKTHDFYELSSVKGEDFTWEGDCEIELSYYYSDKTNYRWDIPNYVDDFYVKVSTPATEVTENGRIIKYEASESDYIPFKIGHDLEKREEVPPTCSQDGFAEFWICKQCSNKFSDSSGTTPISPQDIKLPKTGEHKYENGKCTDCGGFENGMCSFAGASLSLSGNIGLNFYIEFDDSVIQDEEASIHVYYPNGKEQMFLVNGTHIKMENGIDYYVFPSEVAAKEIDDIISVQLITSTDKKSELYSYSVRDYINSFNPEEFDEKTVNLVNAMSDYCDYAKAYFNNETLKATPEMNGVTLDTLNSLGYYYYSCWNPKQLKHCGLSLVLESNTTLRYYVRPDDGADVSEFNFNGRKGDYYYYEKTGITASGLMNNYVSIGKRNVFEFECSPMYYVYIVLESDTADESLKNLCKALYLYGKAASEYKN